MRKVSTSCFPVDSVPCTHDICNTDDEQMLAAAVASANTTAMFISAIATWINETPCNRALPDLYNATGGE